ncbi:MAG: hypothetical protein M1153_01950 [Patescibacteria group bacterium]|nr:hypothetical protein [Patescibacteria group bacterium]
MEKKEFNLPENSVIPIERGKEIRFKKDIKKVVGNAQELVDVSKRLLETYEDKYDLLKAELDKPEEQADKQLISLLEKDLDEIEEQLDNSNELMESGSVLIEELIEKLGGSVDENKEEIEGKPNSGS